MTRRRADDWDLSATAWALYEVARLPNGIRDPAVREKSALLSHRAIKSRLETGDTPAQALTWVIGELNQLVRQTGFLSKEQVSAFAVLMGARGSITVDGTPLSARTRRCRFEVAATRLGCELEYFRHSSTKPLPGRSSVGRHSPETRLYEDIVRALDEVGLPRSISASMSRTPQTGSNDDAYLADLVGTWAGVSVSDTTIKGADGGRGFVRCYMVVRLRGGALNVTWLYESGVSKSIAARLVQGGRRRLVCVYEADFTKEDLPPVPAHRGSCLLDVHETPAVRVAGTYWNDRRVYGTLKFHRHVPRTADSHDEAETMFPAPFGNLPAQQ